MIPTGWLEHRARSAPGALALRDAGGRSLSWGELNDRAGRLADSIDGRGGLVVAELEAGLDHATALAAAMLAGLPFQTLRPGLPAAERDAALTGAGGHVLIGPEGVIDSAGGRESPRAAGGPRAQRVLSRVLTSGTSGARKPVQLTWGNHYASAAASAFNLGVRSSDRWLCCLPVDHVGGLNVLVRSLLYGTAAIVHAGFDPERVAAELESDASVVSLVPTQLRRLLDAGAPLRRARAILIGGGPAPDELLAEALDRGAPVLRTYGLTEACSQVCTLAVVDARRGRGSVGRPLPGIGVEVDRGEIVVSGPTVAPAAAGSDGRLRTGDRGWFDELGFLRVEGRIDDLIVTGGENVAPEEVEVVLAGHPDVAEAAVVGRADPEWGSAVVAVVVPRPGRAPAERELIEHCRSRLARFKVPKRVELASELPRSAGGKLLRRKLR